MSSKELLANHIKEVVEKSPTLRVRYPYIVNRQQPMSLDLVCHIIHSEPSYFAVEELPKELFEAVREVFDV